HSDTVAIPRAIGYGGAAIAVSIAVVNPAVVAPWGLAYFNPLLGGADTAEDTLLIGRGEGLEAIDDIIESDSGGRCDDVVVSRRYRGGMGGVCGVAAPFESFASADYAVSYVSDRQRMPPNMIEEIRSIGPLIGTVEVRGILYAEVFRRS